MATTDIHTHHDVHHHDDHDHEHEHHEGNFWTSLHFQRGSQSNCEAVPDHWYFLGAARWYSFSDLPPAAWVSLI